MKLLSSQHLLMKVSFVMNCLQSSLMIFQNLLSVKQKLKVIYGLAQGLDIEMPEALGLLQTFESEAKRFSMENSACFSNYSSTIDYQDKN